MHNLYQDYGLKPVRVIPDDNQQPRRSQGPQGALGGFQDRPGSSAFGPFLHFAEAVRRA